MKKKVKFSLLLLLLEAIYLESSTGFTPLLTRKTTLSVASGGTSLFAKKKKTKKKANKKKTTPTARGNRFASGFGNDAYNQVEDAKATTDEDMVTKLNALFNINNSSGTDDLLDTVPAETTQDLEESSSSSLVDLIEIPKEDSPSVSNILELESSPSKDIGAAISPQVAQEHQNDDAKEEDTMPDALSYATILPEETEITDKAFFKDATAASDAAVKDTMIEQTQLIDDAAARVPADRYAQEYLQEEHRRKRIQEKNDNGPSTAAARRRQLVQVSESPLIFTIEEFLDPEQCRRVQNDATGCYDLLYPEKLSDEIFNGQESELDGLLFNLASSDDHKNASCGSSGAYPDGLHMDTNNQCMNRHVTCILYLNDVPEKCGGATVFPLARTLDDDPALEAARRLLKGKVSHTRRQRTLTNKSLQADASLIESRFSEDYLQDPGTATAIKIQPKAGKLLIFFSRDSDGHEDPRAWHAGEKIITSNDPDGISVLQEKRILTLFKEVDYAGRPNAPPKPRKWSPLEDYLAPLVAEQREWLTAKAKLQRALLEYNQQDDENADN